MSNKLNKTLVDASMYALANPRGFEVAYTRQVPCFEDKVVITNDSDFPRELISTLCNTYNNILTVMEARPILLESDGNYHYEYNIITKEFPNIIIRGWYYEFHK